MELLGIVVFVIGFIVYACWIDAIVISYLWSWFLVPLGLSAISLPHALGISLFASAITHSTTGKEDKENELLYNILLPPFRAAIFLGIGYITKGLM